MEIIYDESGTRIMLRKEDGTEVDLLKLEGALAMAQTSREFNRRRVEELEDLAHRVRALVFAPPVDAAMAERGKAALDGYSVIMGGRLAAVRAVLGEGDTSLSTSLAARLYTAEEVGDLQASEAELVAAPLRRRIASLEEETANLWKVEKERSDALDKVAAYDRDRHTERDRADRVTTERDSARRRVAELERALAQSIGRENRMETERAELEAEHRQSIAARDRLLAAATTRVKAAGEILGATAVTRAADEIVTTKGAILADAITNARAALDA